MNHWDEQVDRERAYLGLQPIVRPRISRLYPTRWQREALRIFRAFRIPLHLVEQTRPAFKANKHRYGR